VRGKIRPYSSHKQDTYMKGKIRAMRRIAKLELHYRLGGGRKLEGGREKETEKDDLLSSLVSHSE